MLRLSSRDRVIIDLINKNDFVLTEQIASYYTSINAASNRLKKLTESGVLECMDFGRFQTIYWKKDPELLLISEINPQMKVYSISNKVRKKKQLSPEAINKYVKEVSAYAI